VFIGTIGACGTGLNGLQEASQRAVFVESSYVPGQNVQAEDRLHRIGQNLPVLIQYLFAPVALDEHCAKIVAEKAAFISSVLD
jgi:SWI/SNF-related matrix-associated actin-dependent regulator 1 of chromatin subfamily A